MILPSKLSHHSYFPTVSGNSTRTTLAGGADFSYPDNKITFADVTYA